MDKGACLKTVVSAIIPALNEEKTIRKIVSLLISHPDIDEVIVVDDGSTDATGDIAAKAGARVLRIKHNLGKAEAMVRGVTEASGDIIFFVDGDILGLSNQMISWLVKEVRSGNYDMFAALQDRGAVWLNYLISSLPVISGIRALRRELWQMVPAGYKKHYQIELALNYFARKYNFTFGSRIMPGLSQVVKERKRGLWRGLYQRFFMMRDLVLVLIKLYAIEVWSA